MTSLGFESQSQAQSSSSSSQWPATQLTQLAPLEPIAASPLLQGGSGRLNGLNTYIVDEGGSTLIASRYKPGVGPPTPSKRFERGRSSASRTPAMSPPVSPLGAWQVIVGRAADGLIGWYVGEWEGPGLKKVIDRPGVRTLAVLEEKCATAWKAKQIKVEEVGSDRAVGRITLVIGSDEGDEKPLSLRLDRDDGKALEFATFMSIELCRQSEGRRTLIESMMAKLEQSRKLAGVAPPTQTFKVESSLINPGRVKRQRTDDEGFEGDDDEEEEEEAAKQEQQQQQQPASGANGTQGRGNGEAAKKAIDGDETEEEEEEMLSFRK